MNSAHVDLHALDLNLLVAFDALAQHRHVTRAAAQAHISQSAMSHTLKRLRALFRDPLFVRGSAGLVLTPRAEALMLPLRSGLLSFARMLAQPDAFDPTTATRAFRVVGPDVFEMLALPALLSRLNAGLSVSVVNWPKDLHQRLETGEIDAAVAPVFLDGSKLGNEEEGSGLMRTTLTRDTFRCFVRKGHPLKRASLRAFAAADHLLVSPTGEGDGVVDRALAKQGLTRRVRVRVPQFASALTLLAKTDLVLTAPAVLRHVMPAQLISFAAPVPLPQYAVTLLWHGRFAEDPAHRWLRAQIADVMKAF